MNLEYFAAAVFVVAAIAYAGFTFYAIVKSRLGFLSRSGAIASSFIVLFLAVAYCAASRTYFYSIGGSALIGKVEHGRYFLGNHGRYTEVSESTWLSSYWHDRAFSWVALLFVLMFVALGLIQACRISGQQRTVGKSDGVSQNSTKPSD